MEILALAAFGLAASFAAVAVLCHLVAAADAFRQGALLGALCLLVPGYDLYWTVARARLGRWRVPVLVGLLLGPLAVLLLAAAFILFAESSPVLPFIYAAP